MDKKVRAIIIKDDKVLTIERQLPDMVYWVFPGGRVEAIDKDDESALKRECMEEINVKVKILKMIWERNFRGQSEKFYICKIISGKLSKGNGPEYDIDNKEYKGTHEIKWVRLKDIKDYYLKPEELKHLLAKIYERRAVGVNDFSNSNIKLYGVLPSFGGNIFYKVINKYDFKKEIRGYSSIKKYLPVPKLMQTFEYKNIGVIFFEFEKSIGKNMGLIADYFLLDKKTFLKDYERILNVYNKTFLETLKKIKQSANNYFFKDRIKSRVEKYYDNDFWLKFENKTVNFNDRILKLTPLKIVKELKRFYKKDTNSWGVISQGDPLSLNVGTKPVFLDFRVAGYNYLMSEFASVYWSNLALDDYFALIYHANSYKDHEGAFSGKNMVSFYGDIINHKINPTRAKMIKNYTEMVIMPCLNKIKIKDNNYNWYGEFRNSIAMRIISVFNLKNMSEIDQLLSLCYLQLFFEINPKSPEKLNDLLLSGKKKI